MQVLRFSALATGILFASFVTPASAQRIVESVSVKVYPHELATLEGRQFAIDRIERAASRLCRSDNPLIGGYKRRRCELRVAEQMVRQVQDTELLAQWQGNGSIRTASRN